MRHRARRRRRRLRLRRRVFLLGGDPQHPRSGGTLLGQHVKLALDAQACAGPVGRAVEAAANLAPTDAWDDVGATQCYTYGTSEGLFAGAGAHATWVGVRDAQNEDYYRREMTGREILNAFGHEAGEMGRRHEEIFRLHDALAAAERGDRRATSRG